MPLTSLALAAVVATLAACAQTPAGPQASQASPAIATTPAAAPAPAPAQPAAPQPLPAAGLSPSEEQIVPRQYANNPKVDAFINEVAARDGLDPARLRALFATANYSATAVKLVRPAPSPSVKNWRVYQSRFLDTIRINAGVKFWRANQATLQRASAEFGV
ncbi:lytic murein transglycosylase, partial [Burkholderia gladioli]|nr:lytic murein transglycosylase [Burkholderia gladioli]